MTGHVQIQRRDYELIALYTPAFVCVAWKGLAVEGPCIMYARYDLAVAVVLQNSVPVTRHSHNVALNWSPHSCRSHVGLHCAQGSLRTVRLCCRQSCDNQTLWEEMVEKRIS